MSAVNHVSQPVSGIAASPPDIGAALRATGVLELSGKNAKFASAKWLSAPVSVIKSLSPVDVVICKAKGCKTLGDLMALRVAWVPYFSESPGLKLLCAQNALRPVLMTYGAQKA